MNLAQYVQNIWSAVKGEPQQFKEVDQRLTDVKTVVDAIAKNVIVIDNRTFVMRFEQLAQRAILDKILAAVQPLPTASVDRIITFRGETLEGVDTLQIKDNEQFTITLANPKDAKGQPSTIDPSKTVFKIDNPFATLTPGTDGFTCLVQGASVGAAQISGSVTDANDPNDVVLFTPLALTVIASDTATIDVTTGPVTTQP